MADGSLSYPPWTHGEFVFPHVSIDTESLTGVLKEDVQNATSLSLKLPALRSNLDCGWVRTGSALNSSFNRYGQLTWDSSDDPYCPDGMTAPATYESYYVLDAGLFGQANSPMGFVQRSEKESFSSECPPMYTWGNIAEKNRTVGHLVSMACNDTMEQVDMVVTFTLPTSTVDISKPLSPMSPRHDSSSFPIYSTRACYGADSLTSPHPRVLTTSSQV